MTVIARQPIKKGDPIYHSYAREFTTTTFRRLILFSGNIYDNSSRFDSTKVICKTINFVPYTFLFYTQENTLAVNV